LLTSALVGGKWLTSFLGWFTSGEKTLVAIEYQAGWAKELVWAFWTRETFYLYWDEPLGQSTPKSS